MPSESDTNEKNLNSGDLLVDCHSSEVDREIDSSLNDTNNLKYQHAVKYKISDNEIEETLNDEERKEVLFFLIKIFFFFFFY